MLACPASGLSDSGGARLWRAYQNDKEEGQLDQGCPFVCVRSASRITLLNLDAAEGRWLGNGYSGG